MPLNSSPQAVNALSNLPAGSYVVWATGNVVDTPNDADTTCNLDSGSTTIASVYFDQVFPGISPRDGSGAFAVTGAVTLTSPGTILLECHSDDNSGSSDAQSVSMTAVTVDGLN
jgi:hypothetical protein